MDFWFQMGITIVKGVLAGLHQDPNKATTLKAVLMGVANDIYILYGLTPPAPPAG